MALVTIQRSPSPSTDNDGAESSEDVSDGKSQLRKRSRTPKEKLRHIFSTVRLINKLRPGLSESYFTVKGAALILPHNECTRKTSKKSHGGEMQHHLQAMLHILRPEDTIKIAIRLEDSVSNYHRYMALVSTRGRQDTEECVILGLDCSSVGASVGLVLPVWLGLKIKLGGDGGFSLYTEEHSYLFKPVSVQAMWSAIQSLVKTINSAEMMKYIRDGLTHTWVGYYKSRINHADHIRMGQWNIEGIEVFAPSSLSIKSDDENETIKRTVSQKLKEIMMVVDLDEATSLGLRRAVEEKMGISLTEFKSYFDEEVMRILGQMDEPSEILDFLYLGSEWNASNLEELKSKGVGYILNVTKEIDNFFMGILQYYTVRVTDVEESDLLKHWDKTYKFICKARNNNSKVLVHCKMGVSRSASTVMAFLMKDRRWSVDEAYNFVKARRSCIQPNDGFMEQLQMYEGILTASNKRDIFRSKSDQNLLEETSSKEEAEAVQGSFLGDSLFHMMSHSDWPLAASGGLAHEEEWMDDLQAGRGMTPEMMHLETDLEAAETRSADSMDDSAPDAETMASTLTSQAAEQTQPQVVVVPGLQTGLGCSSEEKEEGPSLTLRECKAGSSPPDVGGSASAVCDDGSGGAGGARGSDGSVGSFRSIKPDSSWIKPVSVDLGLEPGESSTEDSAVTSTAASTPGPDPLILDSNQHQRQISMKDSACLTLPDATETESNDSPMQEEVDTVAAFSPSKNGQRSPLQVSGEACHNTAQSMQMAAGCGKFKPHFGQTAEVSPGVPNSSHDSSPATPWGSAVSKPTQVSSTPSPTKTSRPPSSSEDVNTCWSSASPSKTALKSDHHHHHQIQASAGPHANTDSALSKDVDQITAASGLRVSMTPTKYPDGGTSDSSPKSLSDSNGANVATSSKVSEAARPKVEMGVRQYFFREKIPWSPGKVQKMREGINKTGHLPAEIQAEGDEESELPMEKENATARGSSLDLKTCILPPASMSQSRSCIELGSVHTGDCYGDHEVTSPEPMSLYEKEEIPLEPGTVLRTRREIEERHRFLSCGADEEEDMKASRPVTRTSSLKQDRSTPRLDMGDNLRWSEGRGPGLILSPASSRLSLDDLRRVGGGEVDTLRPVEALKPSMTEQVSSKTSYLNLAIKTKEDSVCDQESLSPRQKGNLDTETLALIREIGSALLMSPTSVASPQEGSSVDGESEIDPKPRSNMVKYFVRKIEQQQPPSPLEPSSRAFPEGSGVVGDDDRVSGETRGTGDECLSKSRPSGIQDTVYAKAHPGSISSYVPHKSSVSSVEMQDASRLPPEQESHANKTAQIVKATRMPVGSHQEMTSVSDDSEEKPPSVFASPAQSPEEEEAPTVRHLVGRFESGPECGLATDQPSASTYIAGGHSRGAQQPLDQTSSSSTHPNAAVSSSPQAQRASLSSSSSSTSSPLTNLTKGFPSGRQTLSESTHSPLSSPSSSTSSSFSTQTQKPGSMLDFDIPVELYELPSSPSEHHPQKNQHQQQPQLKQIVISHQSFSSSTRQSHGPRPFNKQSLGQNSCETRSWRSVRPKSAPDQQSVASGQHHRTSSADYGLHPTEASGAEKSVEAVGVAVRLGSGEEGRKKRRLHGKSFPLSSSVTAGEKQPQKQNARLGQGPFYSSM